MNELLERNGRNMTWLVKVSGISRHTINKWDKSAPTIDKLWRIQKATGYKIEEIAECFRPDDSIETDQTGGEEN